MWEGVTAFEVQRAAGNHIHPLCAMHRQVKYTRKGGIMSSDMFLFVAVAIGSVLVAFLLVFVAIVRGMRKNASGKRGSASSSAPKGDGVHVISRGRDGEILYSENGNRCRFYWEILVGDAMVGVSFPKKDQWDTSIPWAAGRQDEIMQKVAREFVRQQTPGHKVRWADGSFEVLK